MCVYGRKETLSEDLKRGYSKLCVSVATSQRDVVIEPVREVDHHLREREVPVADRMRPTFRGFEYAGVEELEQRVLVGEATLTLDDVEREQDYEGSLAT